MVGGLRSDLGPGDGHAVHLFKDSSVSRVTILRRRLGCVLSVLDGIFRNGLTLSRDLGGAIVSAGPCGPLCGANLAVSPAVGLSFLVIMFVFYMMLLLIYYTRLLFLVRTLLSVVGRSWMLEDDRVHPYRLLKPDLVAPAPF